MAKTFLPDIIDLYEVMTKLFSSWTNNDENGII
jgi:hypothetical protein